MRWLAVVVVALVAAAPAGADDVRLSWPLRPRPAVVRALRRAVAQLEPRPPRGGPGRRRRSAGVRRGAGDGGVRRSAGRPAGGVTGASGRAAHQLRAGAGGGTGGTAAWTRPPHSAPWNPVIPAARPACLHWGAMWGPAARADYVDPLGLLASTRIRLKPLHPVVRAQCARHLLARRCVLVRDTPLISVLLCTLAPKGRTSGVPQARGCAWSCTARSLATVTWV